MNPSPALLQPPPLPQGQERVYAAPDGRLHLSAVDGLRALAALFVVAHHIHRTLWGPHAPPPGIRPFVSPLLYGHYAVSVFIVISGFCLMLPVIRADGILRGGAVRFFRRRAMRILPPYYCAIAFVALFADHDISKKQLLTHLFLVHNLWASTYSGINGAFWSIAVECQIYLLFPLLVLLWRRWGPMPTTLLAVLAGYGGWYALRGSTHAGLTPHFLALFTLGMLGATIASSPLAHWRLWREKPIWTAGALVCAGALCAVNALDGPRIEASGWASADAIAGLGAMCLLVAVSRPAPNIMQRLLSAPLLVWIGMFSYSLYLIHWPLLGIFYGYLHGRFHRGDAFTVVAMFLVAVPLIVIIAQRFYVICELPFIRRLKFI